MNFKQLVIYIFNCITLILVGLFLSHQALAKDIAILTSKSNVSYSVEIADTPALQQKGLMHRKSIPKNQGMLFVFDEVKAIAMWMKNTYIPLDMLFLDEKGIIRHIHENAKPLDETVIACPIPVKYVIELNAGQVKENDIQILNKVILNKKNIQDAF